MTDEFKRPPTSSASPYRTFPWDDEMEELLDGAKVVEKLNWRHGHRDVLVFEKDGATWRTTIDVHHEEGWQRLPELRAVRVRQEEKLVKVWVDDV